MRIVSYTRSVRRDYRRVKSDRYGKILDVALMEIVDLLAADARLARRTFDHALTGDWHDHRDRHIRPDPVLIHRKPDGETLELVRLASHSELGL